MAAAPAAARTPHRGPGLHPGRTEAGCELRSLHRADSDHFRCGSHPELRRARRFGRESLPSIAEPTAARITHTTYALPSPALCEGSMNARTTSAGRHEMPSLRDFSEGRLRRCAPDGHSRALRAVRVGGGATRALPCGLRAAERVVRICYDARSPGPREASRTRDGIDA
jgi:hypothetical protein